MKIAALLIVMIIMSMGMVFACHTEPPVNPPVEPPVIVNNTTTPDTPSMETGDTTTPKQEEKLIEMQETR